MFHPNPSKQLLPPYPRNSSLSPPAILAWRAMASSVAAASAPPKSLSLVTWAAPASSGAFAAKVAKVVDHRHVPQRSATSDREVMAELF